MGCTCNSEPDPVQPVVVNAPAAASTQAEFNKEAAVDQRTLNMVNQYTPQGSTVYSQELDAEGNEILDNEIPRMKVTQTLSPEQQALYDTSNQLSQKFGDIGNTQLDAVRGAFEQPFDTNQFGQAPTINEQVRSDSRDRILQRLQPQMDRDREALRTSLVNQGFETGSEGYDEALDSANRARSDLYLAADAQSGNEMSRQYGLEANVRDRAIEEALRNRNQPLSELSAFMSGSQPQAPTFIGTPQGQIAAPDFLGAEYASANTQNQAAQNNFNQAYGSYNASNAGLYGLLGAGAQAGGYAFGRP